LSVPRIRGGRRADGPPVRSARRGLARVHGGGRGARPRAPLVGSAAPGGDHDAPIVRRAASAPPDETPLGRRPHRRPVGGHGPVHGRRPRDVHASRPQCRRLPQPHGHRRHPHMTRVATMYTYPALTADVYRNSMATDYSRTDNTHAGEPPRHPHTPSSLPKVSRSPSDPSAHSTAWI